MLMVIFGAGASFDSSSTYTVGMVPPGAGQTDRDNDYNRPPLAKDLFANRPLFINGVELFPQCKPVLYRLRDPRVASGQISIETLLWEIEEEAKTYLRGRQELAAVRCYLQYAISQCEAEWWKNTRGITNYLSLLREIERTHKGDEPICLVTFNYDTILEDALRQFGLPITHIDDYMRKHAFYRVFKLHGSTNWAHEIETHVSIEPRNDAQGMFAQLMEHWDEIRVTDNYLFSPHDALGVNLRKPTFPAIAIPVEKKRTFECPQYMIDDLKKLLPGVSKILVIGWRATEAHFLDLLKEKLRPGVYLSIVAKDRTEAEDTRVRIHQHLLNNQPSSTPEVATGFTDFMRSGRAQAILAS